MDKITRKLIKIGAYMKKKKIIYKKIWIWLISIPTVLFFVVGVPLIINKCYINNEGYMTVWGGTDVLSFYGDVLTFIGTTVLGIVVYLQTQKHHIENKQRAMVENAVNFPSITFETEKFDILDKLTVFSFGELTNQISPDFTDRQTKYIVKVAPMKNIPEEEKDSFVQINVNGSLKYKGKARCNNVSINEIVVYYGNAYEDKKQQTQYKLHPMTKNINEFVEHDKILPIKLEMVSNKIFDKKSIIENENNSIFISIKFKFHDIVGIIYNSTLELQYGWNGKRYIFIQQLYTINNIDYTEEIQNG